RDHSPTFRLDQRGKLVDTGDIGTTAETDVCHVADLQDIAAVEGAGRFDVRDLVAESGDHCLYRFGFRHAHRCSWPGDHGEAVEHHDGVLDEHGIRAIVGCCHFDDGHAVALQRI